MTANLSGAFDVTTMLIPREVLGYVETIAAYKPEVACFARGPDYEDIVFSNPEDAAQFPKETLDNLRIEGTKELWIMLLATEANRLEAEAIELHTESHEGLQKQVYDLKYQEAIKFKADREAASDPATVPVPPMIGRECAATGEDPVVLTETIIINYTTSNAILSDYIGILEGIRRIKKAEILTCTTEQQLIDLEWPTWLLFKEYMAQLMAQQA